MNDVLVIIFLFEPARVDAAQEFRRNMYSICMFPVSLYYLTCEKRWVPVFPTMIDH